MVSGFSLGWGLGWGLGWVRSQVLVRRCFIGRARAGVFDGVENKVGVLTI